MYINGDETGGNHYKNEMNRFSLISKYILKEAVEKEQDENGNIVYKVKGKDGFLCYAVSENGEEQIFCEYEGDEQLKSELNEFRMKIVNEELRIGNANNAFVLKENGDILTNSDLFSTPEVAINSFLEGNSTTLLGAYEKAFEYDKGMENTDFPRDNNLYVTLGNFEDFYNDIWGKALQGVEYIKRGELSNEELDKVVDIFINIGHDDYLPWLATMVGDVPGFKQKLFERLVNRDGTCFGVEWLVGNTNTPFIKVEDLANENFVNKIAPKYYDFGEGTNFSLELAQMLYSQEHQSGIELVDLSNPNILEEQLAFAGKIEDKSILRGLLKNVDKSKLAEPEFQEKILNIANDDIDVFRDLMGDFDEEKLEDTEYMLNMISNHPNILQLYKEQYNSVYSENPYRQLIESEEFTDGILSMYAEKISASGEMQSRTVSGNRRNLTGTEFYFAENTPMKEFEEKMSWETRKILSNILSEKLYKISNQLDREAEEGKEINPNSSSHHMFVVSQALENAYSVAEAVYMANQRNLGIFNPEMLAQFRQQGLSVERLGKMAADNTRPGGIKDTTGIIKNANNKERDNENIKNENSHYDE